MTTVMIHVTPTVSADKLHLDDQEVGTLYRVTLDSTVTEDFADAALDVFHANIAVKQLDDFTIEAKNESGEDLPLSDDYEDYKHSDSGHVDLVD